MAELTQKERLQPSLLDRLIDDDPTSRVESREQRVFAMQKLRELVLRDLAWLLNCESLENLEDLDAYPHVKRSVVNFGVPALSGTTLSGTNLAKLEKRVRQAVYDFEPRILHDSVVVRAAKSDSEMSKKSLAIEIEGELWAQPIPLRLYLRTEVDLDTGTVTVKEQK
ncbi:MAG: type VI secretion system baseplate subunit TssE [Planctomycetia bacterium]|nr:type VI secretion system baseplate subunit TssE [Planctomycetia bacterium]